MQTSHKVGKGCGVIFFAFFAVIGLFVFAGLYASIRKDSAARSWPDVACTVQSSQVIAEPPSYKVEVRYTYRFDGREFEGNRVRLEGNDFKKVADAQRIVRRYRTEQTARCYVNPDNPAESVLDPGSGAAYWVLLFPLVFVAVGVGGIWLTLRAKAAADRPVSERHLGKSGGTLALRIIGVVFTLVGAGVLYGLFARPWQQARAAQDWQETPCTIIASRVASHRGSKGGSTYSIEIAYRYTYRGESLLGDRYNFATGSSSGRDWRQKVVAQYPPGQESVCYVNPDDPVEVVLVRETGIGWYWALLPGVFLTIGLALLGASFRSGQGRTSALRTQTPAPRSLQGAIGDVRSDDAADDGPAGAVTLQGTGSSLASFLIVTFFALVWNGIVWGIVFAGKVTGGALIVLGLFGLVGIAILAGAVHQFLSLFNPKPTIHASASTVRLGESLAIRFEFSGKLDRMERLTLKLQAQESATYRRGTDTVTDRHTFHEATLLETTDRAQMRSGALELTIPANSMHSFEAPNNKIVWTLKMEGSIPRWPDVSVDFVITVLPRAKQNPAAPL